jgi:PAS domain S-box-containing protein
MIARARPSLTEGLLNQILESADLGVIVTNRDGVILSATPTILDLTGFPESEVVGQTPRIFRSGSTPPSVYQELWKTIQLGRTWRGALLNRRKDGAIFLDRETILGSVSIQGEECHVAIHRDASEELELRLKLSRTGAQVDESMQQVEEARQALKSVVDLSAQQAEKAALALIATLEARDPNTAGHGMRTSILMDLVGDRLGIFATSPRDLIRVGAILHDLGKIGVPDRVLLNPGRLTDEEFALMKAHPTIGFEILKNVWQEVEPLQIVRSHHERLDGSGYPDGLIGSQIPNYVRIFSVVDCFDAMVSPRPYRQAMPVDHVLSILTQEALAGRLDSAAVGVLKQLWDDGTLSQLCGLRSAA